MDSAPAPRPRPVCRCRACGAVMDARFQPGLLPDRPGHYLVTCWVADCWMRGYTLADTTYGALDLAAYRPQRAALDPSV